MFDVTKIAGTIDHTLLKPTALPEDIAKVCSEARDFKFATVCVNPGYVSLAAGLLKGSEVGITTVVGFPLGANLSEAKAWEANRALELGATEIDMVINIGRFLAGDYSLVEEDIRQVVKAAQGAVVKVILETAFLNPAQVAEASRISCSAGAHFVKTSTGFASRGASIEDIRIMRQVVGPHLGVKASGGIQNRETALAMLEAGANRLGASAGIAIVRGEASTDQY
jgi:deoxyribose-phosphate aldolase